MQRHSGAAQRSMDRDGGAGAGRRRDVCQGGGALDREPELMGAELERRRQESLKSDPLERRRGQLTQELKRVEQQIDKLLDAYQEGLVPLGQLRQRMPQLRRKQQTAEKELDATRWQALMTERTEQLEQSLESFVGRLRHSAQCLSVPE